MPENSNLFHLKIIFLALLQAKKNKYGVISGQLKYITRAVRRKKVESSSNGLLGLKSSNNRQDRQCTDNVTFRRVRMTNVAVEKQ